MPISHHSNPQAMVVSPPTEMEILLHSLRTETATLLDSLPTETAPRLPHPKEGTNHALSSLAGLASVTSEELWTCFRAWD